jgi:hypothetical protein
VNITQLEHELGITLHDALLCTLSTDFINRTAELVLEVCVGDPDAPCDAARERHRKGRLELTGLEYLAVDPPDPAYPYRKAQSVDIDPCDADLAVSSRYEMPEGAFAGRLFVSDWNAFIHFAAMNATMSWVQPE